ncbi:hypothetical protein Y1Q_0003874 [Alligator mississippiensis]|uniref:Uncharacterized protein n=1 Tax=Alligator mississippiensis TaxID=8496 RepID=A0A151MNN9_ALLMI|nr:hypothetical protein Y1Q_0003874 [Alligator mississippiensis]
MIEVPLRLQTVDKLSHFTPRWTACKPKFGVILSRPTQLTWHNRPVPNTESLREKNKNPTPQLKLWMIFPHDSFISISNGWKLA